MSGATEIYICQPGQALKEGRVEYGDIETREEAEEDAQQRCRADPSIAKVAYYAVGADGGFKCICTYENPAAAEPRPARKMGDTARRQRARKTVSRKPSLLQQIRAVFEED